MHILAQVYCFVIQKLAGLGKYLDRMCLQNLFVIGFLAFRLVNSLLFLTNYFVDLAAGLLVLLYIGSESLDLI